MNNCPDRRGQAVQVGAIVTLGFVVLAISIFQAQGVPQETIKTEVEHNQEIADQLETFNASLAETTITKTPQTTTLRLGTSYDGRPFFVYPPPTAGSLETEPGTVEIKNAVNESGPFENYWNNETRTYNTSSIQYQIDYHELRDTPDYTFEYGFYAEEFENGTQANPPVKPLINDTEITLIVYDGELAEQSPRTESVVVERVTDETNVTITEEDDPITLNLSTELDGDSWDEALPSVEESYINDTSHGNGNVSIELDPGEYELTVHKVDVGSNATEPEPTYLRDLGNDKIDVRTAYNDRVDETVGAWVFNEDGDLEDTLLIPPDGVPRAYINGCLSLTDEVGGAASYETLEVNGACP